MPNPTDSKRLIDRRHPEWSANQVRWRWLLDSYEGGEVYRQATYGMDPFGCPLYNLRRHKREAPIGRYAGSQYNASIVGEDPSSRAGEDDFQLRRAGTPIPDFVREAVEIHLATVYETEIKREGPASLEAWWNNVDGNGTEIKDWLADDAAPLLLVLGQLDFVIDHPLLPDGESVVSKADEIRLKVNDAVISYILPQNMVWWELDTQGRYTECLVCEPQDDDKPNYRHWTATESTLYDSRGEVLKVVSHKFKRVPIVRVFDKKSPRCANVGKSRYEVIADLMRSFYNRDSELILSDTTQAFPILQGPEDYFTADGSIPIGPNFALPKKKSSTGSMAAYEAWEVLDFPKGTADSIRTNKNDIRDAADRAACLTKPAGAAGSDKSTVAQSGISKRLDATNGSKLLAKLAGTLARAERQIAELVLVVLGNGTASPADIEAIKVSYPGSFDLFSADELAGAIDKIQKILAASGQAPETEKRLISSLVRQVLPGLEKEDYDAIEDEITETIDAKSQVMEQQSEAGIDPKTGQPIIPPPELTSPQSTTSPAKPAAKAKPKSKGKPKPPRAA